MAVVLEILRLAQRRGDRVLIFSRHLCALDLLELFFARGAASCHAPGATEANPAPTPAPWTKDKHWFRIDGSISAATRQDIARKFNSPRAQPPRAAACWCPPAPAGWAWTWWAPTAWSSWTATGTRPPTSRPHSAHGGQHRQQK